MCNKLLAKKIKTSLNLPKRSEIIISNKSVFIKTKNRFIIINDINKILN